MERKGQKMLPVNVVADRSGYSERWLRELARRGEIEAVNSGVRKTRVSPASVEAYRQRREEG